MNKALNKLIIERKIELLRAKRIKLKSSIKVMNMGIEMLQDCLGNEEILSSENEAELWNRAKEFCIKQIIFLPEK